jgi:hypothetical protein
MEYTILTALLGLFLLLTQPTAAFFKITCSQPVVVERYDPITSSGTTSGHVHTVMGANGFSDSMDDDSLNDANCTTCSVTADHSNYWVPNLYYQAEDGHFESVNQVGGTDVYYL